MSVYVHEGDGDKAGNRGGSKKPRLHWKEILRPNCEGPHVPI